MRFELHTINHFIIIIKAHCVNDHIEQSDHLERSSDKPLWLNIEAESTKMTFSAQQRKNYSGKCTVIGYTCDQSHDHLIVLPTCALSLPALAWWKQLLPLWSWRRSVPDYLHFCCGSFPLFFLRRAAGV